MFRSHIVVTAALAPLLWLMAASAVFGEQNGALPRTVIISAIANEQTHEIAKEVVRTAYERIGVRVRFDELPARRALEWANSGKRDADLARIAGTEKTFPNLLRISTPVTEFKGVAFTRHVERDIRSWHDLKGLSVGIISGIRYSEIGTKGLDRVVAKDMTHLFTLLAKERVEAAIAVLDAGRIEIARNFSAMGIHPVGQPLHSSPLFHFVHKKNSDLVPQLETALQLMQEAGEIELIRTRRLEELLSP